MARQISVTMIILMLIIGAGVAAQEENTPPAPSTPVFDNYYFPTGLFCSEIDTTNVGPSWGDIQIGVSSLENLNIYINGLSDLYQTQGLQGDRISYYINPSRLAETESVPPGITACVVDGIIWLLQISTQYQADPTLHDFLGNFGLPDTVTWTEFPQTRSVFWFDYGIMAEVNIDVSNETIDFGDVLNVVYFPIQDSEGFENRWPYNRTRSNPPFAGDIIQTPPLSTEQNPFDFDSMVESRELSDSSTVATQETIEAVSILSGCSPDLELRLGPTWRTITVGETPFIDIEDLYGVRFTRDYDFSNGAFTNRFYVNLTSDAAYNRGIAQYAEVCIVDTRIAALELTVDSDSELPASFLRAWVQQYGEPSLVTWGMSGNNWNLRTVVWPQEGIILMVDAGPTINDPTIARINSIIFAPFSTSDNFLSEWPYSNLPNQPPTSEAPDGLEEQNPFDFEGMLANQGTQP